MGTKWGIFGKVVDKFGIILLRRVVEENVVGVYEMGDFWKVVDKFGVISLHRVFEKKKIGVYEMGDFWENC